MSRRGHARAQRGVVLLGLLFAIIAMLAGILLTGWNSRQAVELREARTQQALQQAKEALIGYAAAYANAPGRLPCPEDEASIGTPLEGQAKGSCTTPASRLGRLPWRTLKTGRLVDGSGEPLWYALSPGFSSAPINHLTAGQLTVNGVANAAVALIISPGSPTGNQLRAEPSAANPPLAANYLDLSNASNGPFVTSGPASTFNDRLMALSASELFATINRVVLAEVRGLDDQAPNLPVRGLRRHFLDYGEFPWAAPASSGSAVPNKASGGLPYADLNYLGNSTWLANNGWLSLVSYTRLAPNRAQIQLGTSTLTVLPCSTLPCP
ncbi:type II secretion system protein [Dechloromonas agitata]|uniref:type II secretion system protein n=1 Tax=Dechloromonas agitata TaxID=73030 RepID=UPI0004849CDF|nr:type II secretion system protein [Dechloromonas agitata]